MLKLDFLGQWITAKGVVPVQSKIKAIRERGTPTNIKDILSFWDSQTPTKDLFKIMQALHPH